MLIHNKDTFMLCLNPLKSRVDYTLYSYQHNWSIFKSFEFIINCYTDFKSDLRCINQIKISYCNSPLYYRVLLTYHVT